jgi:hypothetical protein
MLCGQIPIDIKDRLVLYATHERAMLYPQNQTDHTAVMDAVTGVGPFLLLEIPILAILLFFPEWSLFLPSRMCGKKINGGKK